jgi:cytochrome c-type biogenesis protein
MVAAVNPCGFAMLPAYLSLYLGAEEEGFAERSAVRRALRALLVGLIVSMGFVAVIALAGAVISAGGTVLIGALPVLGVLVGEALIVIGLWIFLGGRSPYIRRPF